MIKSRIFLKSARKGQLKNVQDGISRPLGGREIQKTKVETVLRDTLYKTPYKKISSFGLENISEYSKLIFFDKNCFEPTFSFLIYFGYFHNPKFFLRANFFDL